MTYIFMRRVVVQPLRRKSLLNLETFLKFLHMVSLHFSSLKFKALIHEVMVQYQHCNAIVIRFLN